MDILAFSDTVKFIWDVFITKLKLILEKSSVRMSHGKFGIFNLKLIFCKAFLLSELVCIWRKHTAQSELLYIKRHEI
jgi:hypothetical protein